MENYIKYVEENIQKYGNDSCLIYNNEISPAELNRVLAEYLPMNLALIADYQRRKVEEFEIKKQYDVWYSRKFVDSRNQLLKENTAKTAKISVKEIESTLIFQWEKEYLDWQEKIKEAEFKVSFLLRLLEIYKKFDQILVTLSNNLRQEMRSISLDKRMSTDYNNQPEKDRSEFPERIKK